MTMLPKMRVERQAAAERCRRRATDQGCCVRRAPKMTGPGPRRAKIGGLPSRPFAREREGLELRHGAASNADGSTRRAFIQARTRPVHPHRGGSFRTPAPRSRPQRGQLAMRIRSGFSTRVSRARHHRFNTVQVRSLLRSGLHPAPIRFFSSGVRLGGTNPSQEKGRSPAAPALAAPVRSTATLQPPDRPRPSLRRPLHEGRADRGPLRSACALPRWGPHTHFRRAHH